MGQTVRSFSGGSRPRASVLCYHSIHPKLRFRSASPELFRTHLEWLTANCDMMSLETLLAGPVEREEKPAVAITFDDGHVDNYENAAPLLEEFNVPATFFLTAGYVDRDPDVIRRFQFLRRAPATDMEPVTWTQVNEMAARGFSIQAHTYSHANLYYCNEKQLDFEIGWAKSYLEDKIGRPVTGFAYPFGRPHCHFDRRAIDRVRAAGFRYATTVSFQTFGPKDDPLLRPRFSVKGDSLAELADKVSGYWDAAGAFHDWCPRWLGRLLHPTGYRNETYGGPYQGPRLTADL
jgi:peptidoglycan/xylan/chitin deacetylase (PgdA/CDA1 family)